MKVRVFSSPLPPVVGHGASDIKQCFLQEVFQGIENEKPDSDCVLKMLRLKLKLWSVARSYIHSH